MARFLAVALVVVAAGRASADGEFQIPLPKPAFDFALNPETGGLAVVVPTENEVVLRPRFVATAGKSEPIVARVGRKPTAIAFKKFGNRSFFAVVSHDDRELTVLDAVTLKVEKTFPLAVPWPSGVVVSANPTDAGVYYSGHNRERTGVLGRVNLETMTDDGVLLIRGGVHRPALSFDGTRLYLQVGNFVDAHEFVRPRPVPGPNQTAYDTRLLHRAATTAGSSTPQPDPFGSFVVSENRAMAADMKSKLGTFPFIPILVSSVRPVVYGFQDGRLAAASVNTFKVVGAAKVPLPVVALEPGANLEIENPARVRGVAFRYSPRVIEDDANKTLLVCTASSVVGIPVAKLAVPDEPFLAARVEGSLEFAVGKPREVRITPAAGVTIVELVNPPEGMKLAGNTLTWTPGESAVGVQPFTLRISAGAAERTVTYSAGVTRASIPIPFPPVPSGRDHRVTVSTDGAVAVLAGPDPDRANEGRFFPPSVVAVFDLARGTVAAKKDLLVGVSVLAADARYVYAGLADSDAVYVLNRADLSEVRRIVTPSRVNEIVPVNDKFLVVTTNNGGMVLKVPEWEPTSLGDLTSRTAAAGRPGLRAAVRYAEGWWANGVLYDAAFEKPRAVVIPAGYWRYAPGGRFDVWVPSFPNAIPPDAQKYENPTNPLWFARWGVTVTDQRKLTNGVRDFGTAAATDGVGLPSYTTTILGDAPVVASLAATLTDSRLRVEVVYQNLTDAKPVLRVPIVDEQHTPDGPPALMNTYIGLAAGARGAVVAVVANRLFTVAPQNFDAASFPPPVRFAPENPPVVVGDKPMVIPLPAVRDAAEPVEITLRKETRGVTIDRKAWALAVDPAPLLTNLTDGLGGLVATGRGVNGMEVVLDRYLEEVGPRFEKLTGRRPAGVPVWVPVSVVAQDKNQRTAEADVGFFVDVPLAPVRAKAATIAAAKAANPPKPAPMVAPAQIAEILREQGKLQLRVETLEKKIDDLTDKIDALTKALEAAKKNKKD